MSANPSSTYAPAPALALADWLERLERLHPKKIDLSLDRVRSVVRALDLEQPPYRVLSIGGTNGKGSCVAMLEAIYAAAGYRVGAYTSPHLWRFNERIRIDRNDASDGEILTCFEEIDRARGETTLSYFEFTTIAACLYFARHSADVALLEIGLGGRLDAVNAIEPDLALVTSIAIDHTHWLGDTRESIGYEKAGIFRAARPAIVGDRNPPATLLSHANAIGADLKRIGVDFDFERAPDDGRWSYRGPTAALARLPAPALPGAVQYANAAACVAAVEALQGRLSVPMPALEHALGRAVLRARLESYRDAGVEWVFDIAHNPAAVAALADELDKLAPAQTVAVVGLMADKDARGVFAALADRIDQWILTRADSERAAAPDALRVALAAVCDAPARIVENVAAATAGARALVQAGQRVVVFGSFQVVGPAMAALELYCAQSSSGNLSAKWTGV